METFVMKKQFFLILIALFVVLSCETALGPNEIGGSTDIELTQVGNDFGLSFDLSDFDLGNFGSGDLSDSIVISKNENGIITFSGKIETNMDFIRKVDTVLGTSGLPRQSKDMIIEAYRDLYDARIDTSDYDNIKVEFDYKLKITSEGMQDFMHSKGNLSKPFTIVKYGSNVGDKYEFTTDEGKKITRTVIQKNPSEDWDIAFWRVKSIRVEEELIDDPLISKVIYVCNHKFGLVGLIMHLKDGKVMETIVFPPSHMLGF